MSCSGHCFTNFEFWIPNFQFSRTFLPTQISQGFFVLSFPKQSDWLKGSRKCLIWELVKPYGEQLILRYYHQWLKELPTSLWVSNFHHVSDIQRIMSLKNIENLTYISNKKGRKCFLCNFLLCYCKNICST